MIKKYTTKLVTFAIDRTCTSQSQKQGKRFPAYCSCRAYFVVHPAVSKRLQKIMSFPQESAIPTLIHITKSLLKDASYDRLNNLPQFVHILMIFHFLPWNTSPWNITSLSDLFFELLQAKQSHVSKRTIRNSERRWRRSILVWITLPAWRLDCTGSAQRLWCGTSIVAESNCNVWETQSNRKRIFFSAYRETL